MAFQMTIEEREAFLAGPHVGVLSLNDPGRGPLTAPVWYAYEPGGEIVFVTSPDSRKGKLLEVGTRLSLCAQDEAPPYKYVSVEGQVTSIEPADAESTTRPIAHRYLGEEGGDAYMESSAGEEVAVTVRVRLDRWLSVDYSKGF